LVLELIHHCDLINGDIRDLFVLVTQVKNAALYVDHIALERRVNAARHVYLLSHQLF
jgi:hypothetical protein